MHELTSQQDIQTFWQITNVQKYKKTHYKCDTQSYGNSIRFQTVTWGNSNSQMTFARCYNKSIIFTFVYVMFYHIT